MSIDEIPVVRSFLYSLSGVIGAYSTIVMVYFKQKNRTCKCDPIIRGNLSIGTHMKVGIGGFLFVSIFRESWEEHL